MTYFDQGSKEKKDNYYLSCWRISKAEIDRELLLLLLLEIGRSLIKSSIESESFIFRFPETKRGRSVKREIEISLNMTNLRPSNIILKTSISAKSRPLTKIRIKLRKNPTWLTYATCISEPNVYQYEFGQRWRLLAAFWVPRFRQSKFLLAKARSCENRLYATHFPGMDLESKTTRTETRITTWHARLINITNLTQ